MNGKGFTLFLLMLACRGPEVQLGAFEAYGASDAGADASACPTLAPGDWWLPFGEGVLTNVPATFTAGDGMFRRGTAVDFAGDTPGWISGVGTYSASLSEFGTPALALRDGRLVLSVRHKDAAAGERGETDRAFWGAEYLTGEMFPHGLFLARLRTRSAAQVQLGFLLTHDKIAPDGRNLGWTGPVMQISGAPDSVQLIHHDSASGAHREERVPLGGNAASDHVYGILVSAAEVRFFVDGRPVGRWTELDQLGLWSAHFVHWIVAPAEGMPFDATPLPIQAEVDWFAHYPLVECR